MKKIVYFMMVAVMAAAMSCSDKLENDSPREKREDILLTKVQETYVKAGNQLGFKLMGSKLKKNSRSCLISPLSSQIALGMLSAGADGTTAEQITSVLGFSDSAEGTMQYLSYLCGQLENADAKSDVSFSNLLLLNSLHADKILPSFSETVSTYQDAEVQMGDFAAERESIMKDVNSWSAKNTKGRIPQLLSSDDLNPDEIAYLINALYFKGKWSSPFKPENTKDGDFTGADSVVRSVPMMNKMKSFNYYEDSDLQALDMGYGNGAYSYTAILPKEGVSLSKVIEKMDGGLFEDLRAVSSNVDVEVSLPKYEQDFTLDMEPLFKSIGLTLPFSSDDADFGKMVPDSIKAGVCVTGFQQKLHISVDEAGAEAAVSTVIKTGYYTAPPESEAKPKVFKADHPFIYVISETSTNAILFIGLFS